MKVLFLSREKVENPLLEEIRRVGKIVKEKGLVEETFGNISIRYGKRMIITASGADLGDLKDEDFVEVVDYNPVTNIALVIGLKNPSIETPMHWLIYKKPEINAIIHTHKIFDNVPTTEKYAPPGSLELALEALKALRNANLINLKDHGSIAVGFSLQQALEELKCL
ncbi:MAG: hypothetical protein DRN11_02865 [Thermoplasmata archaeon]|nr:MAG: hypothetical protein DRN11_02865 [Thermoplasmata archaeon]